MLTIMQSLKCLLCSILEEKSQLTRRRERFLTHYATVISSIFFGSNLSKETNNDNVFHNAYLEHIIKFYKATKVINQIKENHLFP